jgi:phosphoribosylaminoimidazole (AIR) synthetase
MDKYIKNFDYLNGEYILKEFYDLKNMNEVLIWCNENIHLPVKTIYRIFNYGIIYYLDSAKYLQKEIISFLSKNKKKLVISLDDKQLAQELTNFINKYNNKQKNDEIKFL